jgi:hypothetical protein
MSAPGRPGGYIASLSFLLTARAEGQDFCIKRPTAHENAKSALAQYRVENYDRRHTIPTNRKSSWATM